MIIVAEWIVAPVVEVGQLQYQLSLPVLLIVLTQQFLRVLLLLAITQLVWGIVNNLALALYPMIVVVPIICVVPKLVPVLVETVVREN